jgi:hypothetical protein
MREAGKFRDARQTWISPFGNLNSAGGERHEGDIILGLALDDEQTVRKSFPPESQ